MIRTWHVATLVLASLALALVTGYLLVWLVAVPVGVLGESLWHRWRAA